MEISENFRETNSSISTLKIAFNLCNLQFVIVARVGDADYKRKWTVIFEISTYLRTLLVDSFQAPRKKLLENHQRSGASMRERMLYNPGKRKEQRDESGDRVTRNDKERRTKCMRESRGSWGRQTTETAEHEVVRPFKSRFFWPHRHSQNPSIYRSMSNKATCTNRPCFAWQLEPYRARLIHLFSLTADYSYLYVFTSHIRFLPQGKSQDYEAVKNKISRLRICIARGKIRRKKSDRLRERLSHFA